MCLRGTQKTSQLGELLGGESQHDKAKRLRQQDHLSKIYNQHEAEKDNVRMNVVDWNKTMKDVREKNIREKNDLQKSLQDYKTNEMEKYRDILNEQINIKNAEKNKRYRMGNEIKGMNYDDLQGYKGWDAGLHNNSLPGSKVDTNVASAVLNKFSNMNDIGVNPNDEYLYKSTPIIHNNKDGNKSLETSQKLFENLSNATGKDNFDNNVNKGSYNDALNKAKERKSHNADFYNNLAKEMHNDNTIHHKLYAQNVFLSNKELNDPAKMKFFQGPPPSYNVFKKKRNFGNDSSNIMGCMKNDTHI